jgi:hypothetical protein
LCKARTVWLRRQSAFVLFKDVTSRTRIRPGFDSDFVAVNDIVGDLLLAPDLQRHRIAPMTRRGFVVEIAGSMAIVSPSNRCRRRPEHVGGLRT